VFAGGFSRATGFRLSACRRCEHREVSGSDAWLVALAARLEHVSGIVGVMLGGSRARSVGVESSDFDIGLYYRPPLDTAALSELRFPPDRRGIDNEDRDAREAEEVRPGVP
jgi:predicted nucleotidyltransferase